MKIELTDDEREIVSDALTFLARWHGEKSVDQRVPQDERDEHERERVKLRDLRDTKFEEG